MTGFAFSPDGGLLAYLSDETGRPQPWLRPADGTGEARELPVAGIAIRVLWRPDGRRVLVQLDPDGTENTQLWELDPASGRTVALAAEDGVRHEIGVPYGSVGNPYSPDSRLLAFARNARDESCFDVLVRDLASGAERMVLRGDDRYFPLLFSPDSRQLLVMRLHQNTEHDLFCCDLATDEITNLTPHTGPGKYLPAAWTEDGIYLCTTEGRDFVGLARLVPGEPLTWLATPDTDVLGAAVGDGVVYWAENEDAYTRLRRRDLRSGEVTDVVGLPAGVAVQEYGHDGQTPHITVSGQLAVLLTRPDADNGIYLADPVTRTAHAVLGGARHPGEVSPEVVKFPSVEGITVPALLFRPPGVHSAPAVLHIHGGPEGLALPEHDALIQGLLRQGIGVLQPNIRGSSGYGLRYQRLIYRDWGGGDLDDLAAATEYLAGLDWVDRDRLGVYGASYGGFAALNCLTRLAAWWRTGVAVCAPGDLITDVRTFPPTWRHRARGWVGDPDDPTDARMLTAHSPVTHLDKLRAPLLLIHGTNDSRVDPAESERVYETLKSRNHPVRLVHLAGEGHVISDRANQTTERQLILDWFARYLS